MSLSVSATLLGVLASAQNSVRLVSAAIRSQDSRLDQIYHRLLAEKKRTEGWASHMPVFNSTDLRATIPSEACDEVVVLLAKFDTYYRQAQERLSTFEGSKEGHVDSQSRKARSKSLLSSYDDLKEFVGTLAAMNNALDSIAPPLPTCSPKVYRDRSSIRFSSPMTMDNVSLAAKPPPA